MALKITTAPTAVRKLVKSAPYVRRQINQASKAEQAGTAGAREERERVTARFARDIKNTEKALAEADAVVRDLDRAAIILSSRAALPPTGPVSALAAVAVRLAAQSPAQELTAAAAKQAREAHERAQDRYDLAEPELRSVALLCQLSALMPDAKFDSKSPRVAGVRRDYLDACQIAADRRKAKT
ncbi:MAG: hypothetical protein JXR15_13085 [Shimia sp.]|uniref:hypothetical protein n=1 Tax=Shimia sp. TaxID=1954381 RepID=UPI003B8D1C1B